MSPEFPKEIEIERVINLVQGFGWVKVKEEVVGDDIILSISKKWLKPGEMPTETPGT